MKRHFTAEERIEAAGIAADMIRHGDSMLDIEIALDISRPSVRNLLSYARYIGIPTEIIDPSDGAFVSRW